MAHDPKTRAALRAAYVGGQSLEEAAAGAGVSISSARTWKARAKREGDDWEAHRAARLQAQDGPAAARALLEEFLWTHREAITAIRNDAALTPMQRADALAKLTDSLNKTLAASARLDREAATLADHLALLSRLGDFVQRRFPRHGPAFLEILEPFGRELTSHAP